MKTEVKALGLLLIIAILVPFDSYGYIAAPMNARKLVNEAVLVCKGEVKAITDGGMAEVSVGQQLVQMKRAIASFRVDRVIKGSVSSPTIQIEFFTIDEGRGPFFDNLQNGDYCIVFLKKLDNGRYSFQDPNNGKLLISRNEVQNPTTMNEPLVRLKEELILSLNDYQTSVVAAAIEQLGNLQMKEVAVSLKQFEGSQNLLLQGKSLDARLKLGDPSSLGPAVNYIEDAPTNQLTENTKAEICHAIGRVRDPIFTEQLENLLNHSNAVLRQNVAEALRSIKSESSIPYFIKALDDDDSEVRYHALMGLATLTKKGGDWAPAYKLFLENESKPISLWKDWWQKEGKERFGN